jgi:peptidyl-prolyl cis-trans isomerase C
MPYRYTCSLNLKENPMTHLRSLTLALALASVALSPVHATTPVIKTVKSEKAPDYTILKINGEEVKRSVVDGIWMALFPEGSAPAFDSTDDKVKQNVLRGVVGEYLLYKKAVESNIEQKPEVQNRLNILKKKLVVEAFLEEKAASQVTPAAVKAEYDKQKEATSGEMEVRASHVLVKDKETADKLLKEIKAGKSFDEVAKANSTDKSSAIAGGDLGYFTKDKMVKEFADAAFTVKVGEVSEPVKTDFGWHIIKVTDSRKKAMQPFIDARPAIEQKLRGVALGNYINSLVDSSAVDYLDKDGKKLDFTKVPRETKAAQ